MERRRRSPVIAASLPTFYDLYQTLLAIIGMIGMCRILLNFAWPQAIAYSVATVMAYWAGTGLTTLCQALLRRPAKPSAD
jgi:uncharacterized membrane protein